MTEAIRQKSLTILEIISELKSSNALFHDFKMIALIFLKMVQTELQRYIFETSFYIQYTALEKSDLSINLDNIMSAFSFSLDKHAIVG